jgi:hypothetical protein
MPFRKRETSLSRDQSRLLALLLKFNRAGLDPTAPEPAVSEINVLMATKWPRWRDLAQALKEFATLQEQGDFIQALFNFQNWCMGYTAAQNGLSPILAGQVRERWATTARLPFFTQMRVNLEKSGNVAAFDNGDVLDPMGSIWTLAWIAALGGPHPRDVDEIRESSDIIEATAWLEAAEHRFENALNTAAGR